MGGPVEKEKVSMQWETHVLVITAVVPEASG